MCYAMDALNNYDSERQRPQTLEEMQAEVVEVNARHNWDADNSDQVQFFKAVLNLHGEVSEIWEAWRKWGLTDATPATPEPHQLAKPEGVGSEFADVLIRLLDDCARFGIDLRAEYERKIAYNRVREYRHGGKRA